MPPSESSSSLTTSTSAPEPTPSAGGSSLEIISAPYTPFLPNGKIHLNNIGVYADTLLAQSVNGVFICGTTGEGASLTIAERKAIAEEWKKASSGRLSIIVHVGHNCLEDAADLARHAQSIGADAIAATPPSFFKVNSDELLIQSCSKVAMAAPDLPFYYYHIPSMTHTTFPVSQWMKRAGERIPNFSGVKFTDEDIEDFQKCAALLGGKFKCYFGRDELLLTGLQTGARAAVGSTYNYAARLYRAIDAAFAEGKLPEAERLQQLSRDFINVLSEYGFFGSAKFLMEYIGVDCGAPRLPLEMLPKEKKNDLLASLEAIGLFEFVHR